jgi:hypothetical protein
MALNTLIVFMLFLELDLKFGSEMAPPVLFDGAE